MGRNKRLLVPWRNSLSVITSITAIIYLRVHKYCYQLSVGNLAVFVGFMEGSTELF